MQEMTMCTQCSVRNLQQLVIPEQPNEDSDGEACIGYDLNYHREMQKKLMHAI